MKPQGPYAMYGLPDRFRSRSRYWRAAEPTKHTGRWKGASTMMESNRGECGTVVARSRLLPVYCRMKRCRLRNSKITRLKVCRLEITQQCKSHCCNLGKHFEVECVG